jgi:RNA polymerase sigma-70 factor (sigma-E family)
MDAEHAVIVIYTTHYRSLVRLATLLVGDVGAAEQVVQDSFVAMHGEWRRLRDGDKAVPYLRRRVVNGSRSVLCREAVGGRTAAGAVPDLPGAGQEALGQAEHSPLMSALRTLPCRQREALVLRLYLGLPARQTAAVMGVSRRAVQGHLFLATATLRNVLTLGG